METWAGGRVKASPVWTYEVVELGGHCHGPTADVMRFHGRATGRPLVPSPSARVSIVGATALEHIHHLHLTSTKEYSSS